MYIRQTFLWALRQQQCQDVPSYVMGFYTLNRNRTTLKKSTTRISTSRAASPCIVDPNRQYSTMPPFNPNSEFQFVGQPAPNWKIGDGLPNPSPELATVSRKTWDLSKLENVRDSYRLLTSVIIPRPIAFVSTLSADGVPNLAPFSYFSMVSHNPPLISVSFSLSPRRPKDTRNNILATKQFTVNIISEEFAEAANSTAVESPADTDEWLISGLTQMKSSVIKPPYVAESASSFECELYSSQDIPSVENPTTTLVLGLIKRVHIREDVLMEDGLTVDPAKLRPIARLGGASYSRLLEGFDIPRPSWTDMSGDYERISQAQHS